MKIGQPGDHSAAITQSSQAGTAKLGQDNAQARNERKAAGVGVTVSALARDLELSGATAPEIDAEKVDAIRQAIADRSFAVNPEAIADRLLANAREMLQRTQS